MITVSKATENAVIDKELAIDLPNQEKMIITSSLVIVHEPNGKRMVYSICCELVVTCQIH